MSLLLFSMAGLALRRRDIATTEERMNMEGYKTFPPAYETDAEKGGRSAPVIFGVSPDCKERNYQSIRWLCRRGPVPSVYDWDTWLEE
jgi:hypothetical protein